jgi:23S rRNA (cytosine1962-C5)-methyltransferase
MQTDIFQQVVNAFPYRKDLLRTEPEGAVRLFNGFYESGVDLVIDKYRRTLVVSNHDRSYEVTRDFVLEIQEFCNINAFPIFCALMKNRRAADPAERRGVIVDGAGLAEFVVEEGPGYAIDLTLNQDASFYIDTRGLRSWLKARASDWDVLNCFAYTGSFGVAAHFGGARRVIQLDRSRKFLAIAQKSIIINYPPNDMPGAEIGYLVGDFFRQTGRLRREGAQFDCVILDAPYFSTGGGTAIHTQQDTARLINKVRPLVRDGGYLIAINNSLFLSGKEYLDKLTELGRDGCVHIEEIIPVPEDVTGYPQTIVRRPPVDPSPFNHPTKIVVLQVKKKNRVAPV